MFYEVSRRKKVTIKPEHLSKKCLNEAIASEIENNPYIGDNSILIMLKSIDEVKTLPIECPLGLDFLVTHTCLVQKYSENDVVDATVRQVEKFYIEVSMGAVRGYVSRYYMPTDMEYDEDSNSYVWDAERRSLSLGDSVRFRIFKIYQTENGFMIMGDMKGEYMGPFH